MFVDGLGKVKSGLMWCRATVIRLVVSKDPRCKCVRGLKEGMGRVRWLRGVPYVAHCLSTAMKKESYQDDHDGLPHIISVYLLPQFRKGRGSAWSVSAHGCSVPPAQQVLARA